MSGNQRTGSIDGKLRLTKYLVKPSVITLPHKMSIIVHGRRIEFNDANIDADMDNFHSPLSRWREPALDVEPGWQFEQTQVGCRFNAHKKITDTDSYEEDVGNERFHQLNNEFGLLLSWRFYLCTICSYELKRSFWHFITYNLYYPLPQLTC